MLPVDPIS